MHRDTAPIERCGFLPQCLTFFCCAVRQKNFLDKRFRRIKKEAETLHSEGPLLSSHLRL